MVKPLAFGLIVAFACCPAFAGGTLNPELLLSTPGAAVGEPNLYIGPGDNVLMAFVENEQVYAHLGGAILVSDSTGHSNPAVHLALSGTATVIYEQADTTPGSQGAEIYYAQAQVSGFGPATNLSMSLEQDVRPVITGGINAASTNVVWVRPGTSDVMMVTDLGAPMVVAAGEEADLATESSGERHLLYVRAGAVYYRFDDGTGFGAEVAVDLAATATAPTLAVDSFGNVHAGYLFDGDIYYCNRPAASSTFAAPINLTVSPTPVSSPAVLAGPTGLKVLFSRDGDLWEILGAGPIFLSAENLTNSPSDPESDAEFAVDSLGYLHVVYIRDGAAYYRNGVPVPDSQFAFDPASGEVPVEVQFTDLSTGVIEQWSWDFGDGESSFEQHPFHLYDATGTYDVSLTTSGPGGQSTLTVSNAVQVIDPQNFMSIQPVKLFQNQQDAYIPVLGTHVDPIQGFQLSLEWDCGAIEVLDITLQSSVMLMVDAEFVVASIDEIECFAILGVVFDVLDPFDGQTLAPSTNRRIANLVCDVPGQAPLGFSEVRLVNGLSDPPIFNIYIVDGVSVLPVLSPGLVEIVPFTFPPPTLFLRGDVDNNGTDEITDAINLLAFLFSGGPTPVCLDAADANDTGVVDVADVIYLLSFLFSGGALVPPPYPNLGLDPTPDPLGDC